jgi:ATP-dependent DNA helicase RecG
LALLIKSPTLSRKEIAEIIGDITEDGIKYHFDKLKQEGKIKRVGGDKGGHWEVIK